MPNSSQQDQYVLTHLPLSRFEDPDADLELNSNLNSNLNLDPDSDAFLLRQHIQDNEEQVLGDDSNDDINTYRTQARPGIFQSLKAIMSREYLLSRTISTGEAGSYGINPSPHSTNSTLESEDTDAKTGKSSALGTTSAGEGSQSRRHRQENVPITRDKTKAQGSKNIPPEGLRLSGRGHRRSSDAYATSDDEDPRSGDEAIDVGNQPKWTDANPPDDSP